MKKVLMVCLGNICRSPLAEGIFRHKIKQHGLNVIVDSAGTAAYHINQMPDERSIGVAQTHGIDISMLKGRQITQTDLDVFDRIYVMDKANYEAVIKMATTENQKKKIKLILAESEGRMLEVPDPYYGDKKDFDKVYALLEEACEKIITQYSRA